MKKTLSIIAAVCIFCTAFCSCTQSKKKSDESSSISQQPTSENAEAYSVNVKKFGAVGDGKTDDTAAVSKAFDSAQQGQTVFFPDGTYLITAPLKLKRGVSVAGAYHAGEIGGSVLLAGATVDTLIGAAETKLSDFSVTNITFDGGKSQGFMVTHAMDIPGYCGSHIANVKITNTAGDGLYSYQGTTEDPTWICEVENYEYSGDGYAMYCISSDTEFNHIRVLGGLGIVDYNYGGNTYNDLYMENIQGSGLTLGIEEKNEVGDIAVTNSTFKNCSEYGIKLSTYSGQKKYVVITGCDIMDSGECDIGIVNASAITFSDCNFRTPKDFHTDVGTGKIAFTDCSFALAGETKMNEPTYEGCNFGVTKFTDKGTALDTVKFDYAPVYRSLGAQGNVVSVKGSDELQPAIDALPPEGGTVIMQGGEYLFSSTVVIPSNVVVAAETTCNLISATVKVKSELTDGTLFKFADNAQNAGIINISTLSGQKKVERFISGKGLKNCFAYNISSNSNTVSNITNLIYLEDSDSFTVSGGVMGVSGQSIIVNLKNCTSCLIQSSYISRGGIGTMINGGSGHTIINNHYDWFADSAIKFTGNNGSFNTVIKGLYCDINQKVVSIEQDTYSDAGVSITAVVSRESGIPARAGIGGESRTVPEFHLSNVGNVQITGCASDCPGRSLNSNLIKTDGTLKNVAVRGNISRELCAEEFPANCLAGGNISF